MPTAASRPLLAVVVGLALLSGCSGGPGADDASSESATPSDARAAGTPSALTPAHGLTLTMPADLVSDDQPAKGSNDKSRVDYYVQDESPPAVIDVEYYTESSRTASSIASLDKEAYAEDGIIVTPAPTTVENSPDAYTYAWEQSTAPPWDETAPAIDLSCQAKTADGPDGYAYGVYVCSPKGNQRSIDAMQAVLDSMSISGS